MTAFMDTILDIADERMRQKYNARQHHNDVIHAVFTHGLTTLHNHRSPAIVNVWDIGEGMWLRNSLLKVMGIYRADNTRWFTVKPLPWVGADHQYSNDVDLMHHYLYALQKDGLVIDVHTYKYDNTRFPLCKVRMSTQH